MKTGMGMIYVLATVCFLSVGGSIHLASSGKGSASLKALLQADSASDGLLQDDSASDGLPQYDSALDELLQADSASDGRPQDDSASDELLQADSASDGLPQDDSASDELLQADSASDELLQDDSPTDKLLQDDVPSEPSGRNTRRQIINNLKADVLSLESEVGSLKENIADNAKLFYEEINRLDARMDNFHPRPTPTQNAKAEMEQPRLTERKSSQDAAA